MKAHIRHTVGNEGGAAILMTMITLLVLTVIGVSAMRTSTYDIRYSGAEKRKEMAFYAADAGIEHAKVFLKTQFNDDDMVWEVTPEGASDPVSFAGAYDADTAIVLLQDKSLGDYKYTVTAWQTGDSQEMIIRSTAVSADGSNGGTARVEIVYWGGEMNKELVKGYKGQAFGSEEKTSESIDVNSIQQFDTQITNS